MCVKRRHFLSTEKKKRKMCTPKTNKQVSLDEPSRRIFLACHLITTIKHLASRLGIRLIGLGDVLGKYCMVLTLQRNQSKCSNSYTSTSTHSLTQANNKHHRTNLVLVKKVRTYVPRHPDSSSGKYIYFLKRTRALSQGITPRGFSERSE